jgi:hypothetical protein
MQRSENIVEIKNNKSCKSFLAQQQQQQQMTTRTLFITLFPLLQQFKLLYANF